jgi:hypothetical protein
MLTPNKTSEALLSSCTWRNISSTTMKTHLVGKHKQGYGDNAYTKEKTWRKQKASESSFLWIFATLVRNKLMKKKTTSSQPSSWDGQDLACWWDQQLSSSLLANTLKGFRLMNQDHQCNAIWPFFLNRNLAIFRQ